MPRLDNVAQGRMVQVLDCEVDAARTPKQIREGAFAGRFTAENSHKPLGAPFLLIDSCKLSVFANTPVLAMTHSICNTMSCIYATLKAIVVFVPPTETPSHHFHLPG